MRLTETPATPGTGTDAAGNPAPDNVDLTRPVWRRTPVNDFTIADFYAAIREDQR